MKGARPTPVRVAEDGKRLGSFTLVADALGVPRQQVYAWARRRAASGFPRPVRRDHVTGHAEVDLYDLDECRAWHLTYVPRRGVPLRVRSDDPNRAGAADVARALGLPPRQVHKWVERRRANGCPTPGDDGLYDVGHWRAWRAERQAA